MSDNTLRPANPISRFLSDEQDPAITEQVFNKVSQLLTQGEEIAYIAVQKPIVSLTPDSVVRSASDIRSARSSHRTSSVSACICGLINKVTAWIKR